VNKKKEKRHSKRVQDMGPLGELSQQSDNSLVVITNWTTFHREQRRKRNTYQAQYRSLTIKRKRKTRRLGKKRNDLGRDRKKDKRPLEMP